MEVAAVSAAALAALAAAAAAAAGPVEITNHGYEPQSKLWGIVFSEAWVSYIVPLSFARGIIRPASFSVLRF